MRVLENMSMFCCRAEYNLFSIQVNQLHTLFNVIRSRSPGKLNLIRRNFVGVCSRINGMSDVGGAPRLFAWAEYPQQCRTGQVFGPDRLMLIKIHCGSKDSEQLLLPIRVELTSLFLNPHVPECNA
jgi:hypothetical protein